MSLTVITAIFNGYERPKAPPPGADRCVLVTDSTVDDRWQVVTRPLAGLSPARAFFPYKLTPHIALADVGDDVIWVDGSLEPTGKDVRELLALVPPGGVGMHRHGIRTSYFQEAMFSRAHYGEAHDRGAMALEQGEHYNALGCAFGVWTSGIIVWRGAQRTLGERWLCEVMAWSASDQVALPYAAHVTGTRITPLGEQDVYSSPYFRFVQHGQRGETTR